MIHLCHIYSYVSGLKKGKNWRKLQHDTPWQWRMPVFVWDFMVKNNVASSFNAPRRWIKDSWWQPSSVVEATGPKTRRFGKGNIKEKDGKGWNDSRIWVLGTFFPFNLWITIHTNEGYWKYVKAPNCSKYIILHMGKGYAGFFPPSKWMNKTPTKVKSLGAVGHSANLGEEPPEFMKQDHFAGVRWF